MLALILRLAAVVWAVVGLTTGEATEVAFAIFLMLAADVRTAGRR
jgi:hypothetical protein